ncbi:MAG: PHP domain-containing protein [Candidatus Aminicenantes bacterium]|nr:MAG: PHP domain-containing protein [Candidatus Aminicenantes bacterium]
MNSKIDLHIHSNKSSDGDFSPFHIVQLAKENALRAISITDHDTVAAYPEAIEFGIKVGVEVIPSIELTTLFDGREFHLLLPFVDWEEKTVFDLINKVVESRFKEAKERVRILKKIGFDISWKEVLKKSRSNPPLGVTIAQILLDKAEKQENPAFKKYLEGANRLFAPYSFYKDYFMEGKPAYVSKQSLDLLDVLKVAPKTEAVPVLSHPGAYFQQARKEDLIILKESGLVGLEVYTFYHDSSLKEYYKEVAQELDLVPTAGSDFHGKIKPHIHFGSLEGGEYWMIEELRKRRK